VVAAVSVARDHAVAIAAASALTIHVVDPAALSATLFRAMTLAPTHGLMTATTNAMTNVRHAAAQTPRRCRRPRCVTLRPHFLKA
jgi:hypothetical protein